MLLATLFWAGAQGQGIDSLPRVDSLPLPAFAGSTAAFTMSEDSLDAPVDYQARDSMFVDLTAQVIHLYGEAQVDYGQISLKANHIVLDYGTNEVVAESYPDSSGRQAGYPLFKDGGQEFTSKRLRYNFNSRKGIVTETVTTQEDIYVRGGKSKFVSGAVAINDTTQADVIYTEGAIFTTCSADHPHFGIRTQKAKVVPNRLAVIGPSNLEIMGVPTPLWLPFGFFPLKSGRSSGLLFPSDYQYSPNNGFGFEGVGWFFPIGEHVNLELTGDIFLKGTYRVNARSTYRRRYKYNGSFNFSYGAQRLVDQATQVPNFQRGLSLQWTHRQDRRAHPTFNFGGSINFQTNQINQRFINSYEVASRNVIRSSMNATKTFPKLKSTLTAGITHSQSNQTGRIEVNFPDARFQTQTIYPLREIGLNPRAWYKKLSFQYRSELRSRFVGQDTSFFTAQTFDEGQYGFRHDANAALSFNLLKYFNLSPSINYEEIYYGKTTQYAVDPTTILTDTIVDDQGNVSVVTTDFGDIIDELNPGLASYREFNAGVALSTQIFGKVKFKGRGILG